MPPRRAAATKAGKAASTKSKPKPATSIAFRKPHESISAALPPARAHSSSYHYPLLIDDKDRHDAFLSWFKSVEDSRTMPWRKPWIDRSQSSGSEDEKNETLNKRAYEVWVSEVSK
jgi:A/G-specific adenine glycosylase